MYPGGKNGCFQKIINLIPPHRVYIEPFLGSGAVMKNKRPAAINVGIEINLAVAQETAQRLLPGSIVKTDVAGASSQIAISTTQRIVFAKDVFICGDALEFLSIYPFQGDEFIYADPPYVRSSRRSTNALYEHEMTDDDHARLLALLKDIPCNVMISGYDSRLYQEALADWHSYTFEAMTRGNSLATEWLWMNYPEPYALHDYSYLGEDYRERERIKRKKQRWVNGLERLDVLERKAILSAIQERFELGQHRQI